MSIDTIARCRKLDLDEIEAKILFQDLFENLLKEDIEKKPLDNKITMGKTEESPLIANTPATCSIRAVFAKIFCCR